MTATPDVYDNRVARWKLISGQAGLTEDQILDGPSADYAGTEGVAVGATARDTTAEFTYPSATLDGQSAEESSIPALIWSGWGETTFTSRRARVKAIYEVLRADLAADRTMGGLVDDSWITGGIYTQDQTGRGALVMQEIHIQFRRF